MTENTNSHVQQNIDAWKKIVDQQVEFATTMTEEMVRLRKLGVDRTFANVEEVQRVSKQVIDHARETVDPSENLGAFKDLMDRQFEVVSGLAKSAGEVQSDGMEKSRSAFDTFSKLSETSLDHAMKLNKAWCDAAIETAKRSTGWIPSV
jgi:hypothetical protein